LKKYFKKIKPLVKVVKHVKQLINNWKYSKYYNDGTYSKGKISRNDDMFHGNLSHYLGVGDSAIQNINESLTAANKSFNQINTVLDLPCGHGRVMRHLIDYIPGSKITGCEIDPDAVEFCHKEFGSVPLISNSDYFKINFPCKYDLIWVGSLFTHVDRKNFKNLIQVLYNNLNKNGLLIFTAHGDHSLNLLNYYLPDSASLYADVKKTYEEKGFFYTPYEENSDYGLTLSRKDIVCQIVNEATNGNLELIRFKFRGWDNHQDVYSYLKK
jgi:SAM-dependent methyltransferase